MSSQDKQMAMPTAGYFQGNATKAMDYQRKSYSNLPHINVEDKEYTLLVGLDYKEAATMFNLMGVALEDNSWEMVDLETSHAAISASFKTLIVSKRYKLLQRQNKELGYSSEGFFIGEHKFETLDEVERALKNKAFL